MTRIFSQKWLTVVASIFLLMQLPSTSVARSCSPIKVLIYGNCVANVCNEILFIDSEFGYGSCSRIPAIKAGSEMHRSILEFNLEATGTKNSGTYEIELARAWYFPEYRLESIEDYVEIYTDPENKYKYPRGRTKLEKSKNSNIKEIEATWIEDRNEKIKNMQRRKMTDNLLIFLGIVPLLLSLYCFVGWVCGIQRRRSLLIAILLNVGVIVYGLYLYATHRFESAGIACFSLGVLLLIIELVFVVILYIYGSFKKRFKT